MKATYIYWGENDYSNFISHMVQMKERCVRFRKLDIIKLYIPHGSDERDNHSLWHLKLSYFISHMVQMKAFLFSEVSLYI